VIDTAASSAWLTAALAGSALLILLVGAAWGYFLRMRHEPGADPEALVGQDVADAPSFLRGQKGLYWGGRGASAVCGNPARSGAAESKRPAPVVPEAVR